MAAVQQVAQRVLVEQFAAADVHDPGAARQQTPGAGGPCRPRVAAVSGQASTRKSVRGSTSSSRSVPITSAQSRMRRGMRPHARHVHAEARGVRGGRAAERAEADDRQPFAAEHRAPQFLPAAGTLVRHHLRHAVGQHEHGHDGELAGLHRVRAAIVQQCGAGRQPVERGEPVEARIGDEQQLQVRGGAGEQRAHDADVAHQRLGVGHGGGEVGIGVADADVVAEADVGGARGGGVPHRAGECEQRIVGGVLDVDAHARTMPAGCRHGEAAYARAPVTRCGANPPSPAALL